MTFDVMANVIINVRYRWQQVYELPSLCRKCHKFTVLIASQSEHGDSEVLQREGFLQRYGGSLNDYLTVEGYISLKNEVAERPPEYLPDEIRNVFTEGAVSLAVGCPNAAGAMFRTCIDLATRALLPEVEVEGLNSKTRRDLGLRLPWLFQRGLLARRPVRGWA